MATSTKPVRIKDILTRDVVAVEPDDSLYEALTLMAENRVSALPVVNGKGQCVGIISSTDIISLTRELTEELDEYPMFESSHQWLLDQLEEHDLGRRQVHEVMTPDVITVGPETTLVEAARKLLSNRIHRLPVVDEKNRLLGVVSTTDLLAAFVQQAEQGDK